MSTMEPKLVTYTYLSANEAKQLVDYIERHPDKHLVLRILTDSSISTKTFVGVNPFPYPGWNPNDPNPIEEERLKDPDEYLYL